MNANVNRTRETKMRWILMGPALFFIASTVVAQDTSTVTGRAHSAVHGSCQVAVKVQGGSTNIVNCDLTIGESEIEAVPRMSQLVIEHVSANCVGLQIGEIAYLALYTKMTPNAPAHPSFIPLARKPFHERRPDQISRSGSRSVVRRS